MGQAKDDLSGIEPCPILREPNFVAKMEEKFASIEEIGDKIQAFIGLKSVVQLDDERMRDLLHNITLNLHLIRLICFNDKVLLERLHCIDLPI